MQVVLIGVMVLVSVGLLSAAVRRLPRLTYVLYRFCGSLSLTFFGYFAYVLAHAHKPRGFLYLYLALAFYTLWYCKVTGLILKSKREGVLFAVAKAYFALFAIVVFPVGMLATRFHRAFEVDRIHRPLST